MSRVWFANELETVATYWRIFRGDGVTLGFTSHDRDLILGNIRHRSSPGMVPSAIRLTAGFDADSAEVEGALQHNAIGAADLAAGRFDGAKIEMGLVDWETLESRLLYAGTIGRVGQEGEGFNAELRSLKTALAFDPVPRTSPTCRAAFCGPGCNLSPARFEHEVTVASIELEDNAVTLADGPGATDLLDGQLRWIDGPASGTIHRVAAIDAQRLVLDPLLDESIEVGTRALVREGCDHRLTTCAARFANSANFRGEPFLPGNDLLTRYPAGRT